MARRMIVLAVACILSAGSSAPAFAALSVGQRLAAEALVKQFSAAEFDLRQKAVDRLIELGPDVAPIVRKALVATADNEVKLRCEMVLKGLKEKFGDAATGETKPATPETRPATPAAGPASTRAKLPPRDPGKFGFDASKVTVKMKEADLDAVLQALADQSGNARVALPNDWEGKPVTLDVTGVTYWEALDKLCASLGLCAAMDMQTREFRLQPLKDTVDVSAYAGPVVVKLDSATLTKRFRGNPALGMMGMGREGLILTLAYFTEDRLQPMETDAEVTKIVAADGKEIALDQAGGPAPDGAAGRGRAARGGLNRMVRRAFGSAGFMVAGAAKAPANVDKLASIEGVVRLTFGAGTKEMKIEDALNGENKSVTVGKATLTVTRVQRMRGGRGGRGGGGGNNNDGGVAITVTYEVDGKEEDLPEFGRASAYGFALIDPKGEKHTSVGGGGGGFQGAPFGGRGGPGNNPDPNNPRPTGATVFFNNTPEIDGAWTLVVTLPEQMTEKEYTFKFTDVSLR